MQWWEVVRATLISEFSDLDDVAEITQVVLRLLIAASLGGLLGFEREQRGKSAGLRTHMLVCLGACLFVLVPQQAGASSDALSRVIQGLATGIGFLGAGTILKNGQAMHVEGLTTAAGIWLTAAIGVAVGLGHEATAVLSCLLALVVLSVLKRLERPGHKE